MKKIIALLFFIVTSSAYAQNSGITYQAVIYNPSTEILPGNNNPNVVLAAKDICLRFSIMDTNSSLEYQEVQKVKTDEFGMVNLIVGDGDQVNGYAADFDAVIWNSTNKNLKVEIDASGNCTNFIEISNQKFSSVPFAYASKTAESISGIVPIVNGGTGSSTVSGAKSNLGLNNVDNTSDLNKPVSTATQIALDTKASLASPGFTGLPTAPTATAGTNTTQIATTAFVNAALATTASPDATATQKGRIQLAGDLGGTADMPTVIGLANKEDVSNKSIDMLADAQSTIKYPSVKLIKDYVDTQISSGGVGVATTIEKGIVKLSGDLEGTADSPTITNSAVIGKVLTGFTPTSGTVMATDNILQAIQKVDGNVALKENTIAAGTTSQYWRGDKTWQTLDKTVVGLGNVDNTADADKPVSTAVQTALNAKENTANKSDVTTLGTSDVLFPTQNAVKTYVDAQISANATPDATASVKGKIQLGGDLAGTGSSAASPVITNDAISTNKIANNAVTKAKIAPGSTNSVLVTNGTGVVDWLDQGAFGAKADDSTIEGVGTTANPFKVKDIGIITDKLANGSVTRVKLADDAVTNAKIGETISVENGGTGATSLTGYLKGNGIAAFTSVSTIPVAHVTGAVQKVNGVVPDANGNVAVIIGRVFTGATVDPNLATSIINATPPKQQSDIYIVADGSNPNNGRTFIYDGTNWLEVATDLSATDARYVNQAGDTMEGNLTFPTGKKIILADAPSGSTDAVNKAYVDGLVTSSATPDATASDKGKLKLTNELGGTADAPTVPGLAFKAPLESPSLTGTPLAPTAAAGTNTTQIATTAFVTTATAGKQDVITLTTTGTGAASLTGSTLNIPTPSQGSPFFLTNTTNDAGVNKTSAISRDGSIIVNSGFVRANSGNYSLTMNAAEPLGPRFQLGTTSGSVGEFFEFGAYDARNNFDTKARDLTFFSTAAANMLHLSHATGRIGLNTSAPVGRLIVDDRSYIGSLPLNSTNLMDNSTFRPHTRFQNTVGINNNGLSIFSTTGAWGVQSHNYSTGVPLPLVLQPAGGNVGIGTINPQNNLDVVGGFNLRNTVGATGSNYGIEFNTNSNAPRIDWVFNGGYIGQFSSDANNFVLQNSKSSSGGFRFVTNPGTGALDRLNILNNGNVGIGTTTPSFGLDMQGANAGLNILRSGGVDAFVRLQSGTNNTTISQIRSTPTGNLNFTTNDVSTRMTITQSGNVGIGTTAPAASLHIQGIQATLGANANATMLRMSRPTWSGFKWGSAAQFNLGTYDDGFSPVNSKSRLDLALANGNDDTTLTTTMTWLANGNVGIRNTAPSAPLVVQGLSGTGSFKLIAPSVASGDNWWMGFGHGTTSTDANDRARFGVDIANGGSGRLFFTTGAPGAQTRAMFIDESQRVGIGTTSPTSRFEVNGSATNTTAFNSGSATAILFNNSNLAYTSASPTAFFLQGIKDGGTYTLAVQGTTSGTASFTAVGFTFKSINNGATIGGKETLYTFVVMGTTVYVYMATGF